MVCQSVPVGAGCSGAAEKNGVLQNRRYYFDVPLPLLFGRLVHFPGLVVSQLRPVLKVIEFRKQANVRERLLLSLSCTHTHLQYKNQWYKPSPNV